MNLIIDNVKEYTFWLKHWMYNDLPCFDATVDNRYLVWIQYVLIIPSIILLHMCVLSGLLTALVSNVTLNPLGKLLNTIKSFVT
jgi:hypothetical protein